MIVRKLWRDELSPGEIVALAERLRYLQALRFVIAGIVVAVTIAASSLVHAPLGDVAAFTVAYLAVSLLAERLRHLVHRRGLWLTTIGLTLLLDGVFLAWVTYESGGTQGSLRFLVYVHLVAVTLVASYRTGLKIALWHSLLTFVVLYAQAAQIIGVVGKDADLVSDGVRFPPATVMSVTALWIVAIVTAVFSALNERELRRRRCDLERLASMTAELQRVGHPCPSDVAEQLLETMAREFGLERGVVLAKVPGKPVVLLAGRGSHDQDAVPDGDDALLRRAWGQKEPLVLGKLAYDENPSLATLLPGAARLVVVPMFSEGQPSGALVVEPAHGSRSGVPRRVLSMVEQLAGHASLALNNAELIEEIQRMAETDPMTGLHNRRRFRVDLDVELARAQRGGEPLTMVLVDVDRFKQVNDAHGHPVGDEVLQAVARALQSVCRNIDTAARLGGDEFAILLPGSSSSDAQTVGERIRDAVETADQKVAVTVSIGLASYPADAEDAVALVQAADAALYAAKAAGRDRVAAWSVSVA